jgi:hypothetical protein
MCLCRRRRGGCWQAIRGMKPELLTRCTRYTLYSCTCMQRCWSGFCVASHIC